MLGMQTFDCLEAMLADACAYNCHASIVLKSLSI